LKVSGTSFLYKFLVRVSPLLNLSTKVRKVNQVMKRPPF